MDTAVVRKALSEGGPDSSAEADQGRPTVSSEPWLGLKDLIKRVPIVRSLDLLSGGDKGDGKEKIEVGDAESKSAAVLVETEASEEPRVEELSADVEEFHDADAASLRGVAGGETDELSAAGGGTPALPTVADSPAMSSEEKLEELRQELERLVKELRASVDSKTAAFKRINKEWSELKAELRHVFKKAEKFHKRYRKTMARLEKKGYILPAAPQHQESPHRRRASVDVTTSSAETYASDVSLVIELRRAASSLYGIQSVDGVSAMSEGTDKQRSIAADGGSAMPGDVHRCSSTAVPDVPAFYDDPDNFWFTRPPTDTRSVAEDDRSDATSLSSIDSFVTAVSELMDQHGDSTAQDQVSEMPLQNSPSPQKKTKLQRLKKWIQRKGRGFCNKICCCR